MIFILSLLFLCNITILPSNIASNQVPIEFLHILRRPNCQNPHYDIKSWFGTVCNDFRVNPETVIEQFSKQAKENNDFVVFLDKVMEECISVQSNFGLENYDHWFTQNPVFSFQQRSFIESTPQTIEDFSVITLFDLFLYLGVRIPLALQEKYVKIYDNNEPILYANDVGILYQCYQSNLLELIDKTRLTISPRFLLNENFINLVFADINILRRYLYSTFEECEKSKNYNRILQIQKLISNLNIDYIINSNSEKTFKETSSLDKISISFHEIHEKTNKILAFLKVFSPKTMYRFFNNTPELYANFISSHTSNPYKSQLILKQLDNSEVQLLFQSLDYTQELLYNEQNAPSTKQYLRNLLHHHFIECKNLIGNEKISSVFSTLFSLLENSNNLSELYDNNDCCGNWIKNSIDENGNTILHCALQMNKNNEVIESVIINFPELVSKQNKENKYPKDIYEERISQASEKNNHISLTKATDQIEPVFLPLEQNIVDILQSIT